MDDSKPYKWDSLSAFLQQVEDRGIRVQSLAAELHHLVQQRHPIKDIAAKATELTSEVGTLMQLLVGDQ